MTMRASVTGRRAMAGLTVLVALWLPAPPVPAGSEASAGKVVGISDGDTLTLLTSDRQQLKLRLAGIDAPERDQPYGRRARQALAKLAFGREARVSGAERDRYGRMVSRVPVGGVDLSAALVRQGAAWVYRDYARDPLLFAHGGRGPPGAARPVGAAGGPGHAAVGMAAQPVPCAPAVREWRAGLPAATNVPARR